MPASTVVRIAVLAAAYVAAARLGLMMDAVGGFATLVWAPTGIALVALLRGGRALWPGVAAGALIANVWTGAPVAVACGTCSRWSGSRRSRARWRARRSASRACARAA